MKKHVKNKKHGKRIEVRLVTIIFIIFLIALLSTLPSFARYIYNDLKEFYLTSKKFYFTSNLLTVNTAEYNYINWGGTDTYEIECELYSYANELLKLDYDLEVEITCTVPEKYRDKIRCGINSTAEPEGYAGVVNSKENIYATTNETTIKIYIIPLVTIAEGESVQIQISAKTNSPYEKTISCNIELTVQNQGNTFTIDDKENQSYALLKLKNLNETESEITLTFDPEILRIDMNDEIMQYATIEGTKTIDGGSFIKKIKFKLSKGSSKNIKFYKVDITKNYSYPQGNTESTITVSN